MINIANSEITAVVLAGRDKDEPLAKHFGVASKALLPIAGKPLVNYVLEALKNSAKVKQIVYVGEKSSELTEKLDVTLPASNNFSTNLGKGLKAALDLAPQQDILMISADLRWLTAEAIDKFIANCTDAAVFYPIIPRNIVEQEFPEQKRTYASLREGEFTGGSLMLIKNSAVDNLLPFAEKAYQARKNLFALARLIGFDITIRFVTRTLSLARLEKHISSKLGETARAILVEQAELAMDIDELSHIVIEDEPNSPRT